MHKSVLSPKQQDLIPFIDSFANQYGLVGGTAIALQLGHRFSIDFDLFSHGELDHRAIRETIIEHHLQINKVLIESKHEFTILVNEVKVTFYQYPFLLEYPVQIFNQLKSPTLVSLAAMKAFALGKRLKWKDFVDLYVLFQKLSLSEVVQEATAIFGSEFNQKLFRAQLGFFEDIDYTEIVHFVDGWHVSDDDIRHYLRAIGVQT
jgi:hypothetical protein